MSHTHSLFQEYLDLIQGTSSIPNHGKQISQNCQQLRKLAIQQAELLKETARLILDPPAMDNFMTRYNAAMNSLQASDFDQLIRSMINSWSQVMPGQAIPASVLNTAPIEQSTFGIFTQLIAESPGYTDFTDIL